MLQKGMFKNDRPLLSQNDTMNEWYSIQEDEMVRMFKVPTFFWCFDESFKTM